MVGPGSGSVVVGQFSSTGLWSEDSSLNAIGSCRSVIFLIKKRSRYVLVVLYVLWCVGMSVDSTCIAFVVV